MTENELTKLRDERDTLREDLQQWKARAERAEKTITAIDGALCNYINGVGDDFTPVSLWDDEADRNFQILVDAYNRWHNNDEPRVADWWQRMLDSEVAKIVKLQAALLEVKEKADAALKELWNTPTNLVDDNGEVDLSL